MRLTCLVDNCVLRGSHLWGEHGLSFLIETSDGNLLWDTGQSGAVLEHNLSALGLQDKPIDAIALSHAHYDHTGGLERFLAAQEQPLVYAHETIFAPRYSKGDGKAREIGISAQEESWRTRARWQLSSEPQEIFAGVRTTGTIAPRPYPQGTSSTLMVKQGTVFVPDTYMDDLSLVLSVAGGIVLLCGCCHAGLRNTLALVRRQYEGRLLGIIGGTHLAGASDAEIQAVVDMLDQEGNPSIYLCHCTGERAIFALRQTFGDQVHACPAGTVITFDN